MGIEEHKRNAPAAVSCAVLTVSSSRVEAEDFSGKLIKDLLKTGGHTVKDYKLVKDVICEIRDCLIQWLNDREIQVIICNGGSGISPEDVTREAITSLPNKEIPGFGELFRFLSYAEIGSASMLSRAGAWIVEDKIVFLLPGSKSAVRLAMEKLILQELGHIVGELKRNVEQIN